MRQSGSIHPKSPVRTDFNPFLILQEHQGEGEQSGCVEGGNKAGCSGEKLGQDDQQQEVEQIFNPFQVAGDQSWIGEGGRLDPGEVVRGQVGSWEEDGSIFNPFAPTEEKAQLEWPRWGELEVAHLGVVGHNVLIQGSVVVIRQFLIFINQTFLMVSVALVTMVD